MKTSFGILLLLGVAQSIRVNHDSVWDTMMDGVSDADDYNKSTPKDYKPVEKVAPKIDYQAMYKKQRAEEERQHQELVQKEKAEKDTEDMNYQLLTFTRTLKPSAMHKALEIKEKLDNAGQSPEHFRVSLTSLWSKNFKHESVSNYPFVKEKLEDLSIAEKNLNRNIDSKAQLDIFLGTAKEVKEAFLKRYTDKEWSPFDKPKDAIPAEEMLYLPKNRK